LAERGARPQRPLWASTATKDSDYSDVRYVEELIAPGVINTMPRSTLDAFADHGDVGGPLGGDPRAADELIQAFATGGGDLPRITAQLERDGVEAFRDSYRELLHAIETRARRPAVSDRPIRA
jgi:transaldolase